MFDLTIETDPIYQADLVYDCIFDISIEYTNEFELYDIEISI